MVYKDLPEELLLNECSDGDPEAFQEVYLRYHQYAYAVIAARLDDEDDAKDMLQEIFAALWAGSKNLRGVREFKPYLYALCKNRVISAYRKQSVRIKGEQYLIDQLNGLQHSSEDHRLARELSITIIAAVEQLPETMRDCYKLAKDEGKKNNEIAGMLNISEKTVRNNVSEALKRLKLSLSSSYPELMSLLILGIFKVFWPVK